MNIKNRTNEEWQELVIEQRSSGQTVKVWCEAHNISYHTFVDRVSRLRKQGIITGSRPARTKVQKSQTPQWLEVSPLLPASVTPETKELCVKIGAYEIVVPPVFEEEAFIRICKALASI